MPPEGDGWAARADYRLDEGLLGNIPEILRERDQWVLWRHETAQGRRTKVPYRVHAPRQKASSTDPQDWNPFESAVRAYLDSRGTEHAADGIGFVFAHGGGLVGFDLDGVLSEDGAIDPWGRAILDEIGASYCEVSPSGRGLKGYVAGELPGPGFNRQKLGPGGNFGFEMYDSGRFFTVTGEVYNDCREIRTASPRVEDLYARFKAKPHESNGHAPSGPPVAGDSELLAKARTAKNGRKFTELFDRGEYTKGSHSEADLALCCLLAFWFNKDAEAIDRVFRGSALMREKWDDPRGATTYGGLTIAKAVAVTTEVYALREAAAGPHQPTPAATGDGAGERPAIEVNTERHRVLAETLAVLPRDPDLFRRGNVLVRLAREAADVAKLAGGVELRQAAGAVRVVMMGEAGLSCRLTALADFVAWRTDRSGEDYAVPVHPPAWLTRAALEHEVYPGVRPLRGVAEVPFPRPDGTLVTTPGYDPSTGTFLAPGVTLEPLPDRPSRADAQAAAWLLYGVVKQFPFVGPDDFAVWLAHLLTLLSRPAIEGPVPGFAFNGNRAGTGKGLLIDVSGTIAMGRGVPCTAYAEDRAEFVKLKVALGLAATPCVHLDNLDEGHHYGGGVLDSALTSRAITDRILGQSKTTEGLELRCVWALSGNNVSPAKDAHRRWLVCNLVTDRERPEERDDLEIRELLVHVRGRRGELVRAALVLLQAHAEADRPTGGWAALGSFEEWDRIVRGAIWYATGRDCNATRRQAAEEAPERRDKLALLEAWSGLPGGGPDGAGLTAADAHRLAETEPGRYASLVEVLTRASRDGKLPPASRIGYRIRGMKGQTLDGRAFTTAGERNHSTLWKVVPVYPDSRKSDRETGDREITGDPYIRTREVPERSYDVFVYGGESGRDESGVGRSPASPASPVPLDDREVGEL